MTKVDTLIPETLYVQGARALSDAINLVAAVQELCDRVAALMATTDTLTKDAPEDVDGTSEAWRWDEATGIGPAQTVLIAIASNITEATSSSGSYLAGETAHELRQRFESQLPANET